MPDQGLLPELARSRLIVTARGPDGEPIAEIAHEALIRECGRLKIWVAEDLSFLLWQEDLRGNMNQWETHAKHPGWLLTGPPLPKVEGWLAARASDLAANDSDYIHASRRRAKRRNRAVRAAVAAVILILAAFGGLAWWQWQQALKKDTEANQATQARQEAERLVSLMVSDLRGRLQPIGRLDLLAGISDRVDDYYKRLGVREGQTEILRQRAANSLQKGDILAAQSNLQAAQAIYVEVSVLMARLAEAEPDNPDRQHDLSVSLNKVGDIPARQGDLAGALRAYEESMVIAERLADAGPSNANWQLDLVVLLWKLSLVVSLWGLSGEELAGPEVKHSRLRISSTASTEAGWIWSANVSEPSTSRIDQ